jgi:hypothetical protein
MMGSRVFADGRAQHRKDQDGRLGDGGVERGHIEHQQDVHGDHQRHGCKHRADATAPPAAKARSAQHNRREHRQ